MTRRRRGWRCFHFEREPGCFQPEQVGFGIGLRLIYIVITIIMVYIIIIIVIVIICFRQRIF